MSVVEPKIFHLDEYIEKNDRNPAMTGQSKEAVPRKSDDLAGFYHLCSIVKSAFRDDLEQDMNAEDVKTQRNAIIGHLKEVNFYKAKIDEFLKKNKLSDAWYPRWYTDLVSAIFHENWGLAGVAPWKDMPHSSSCKIIGERIYFLINGKQVLQEQTISSDRLRQLIRALMLLNPEQRLEEHTAETYTLDKTRIKIFTDGIAKEPTIIFRKDIVEKYTFEEQAERQTIPYELIPLLKQMVRIGYNVGFVGAVRSGKTTFLQTYQSYEDDSLEGIQVETDPEIPLHRLMPKAPILQLVADGDRLSKIIKDLLRGDGDYLIMAEARDAVALKVAIQATARGTRRVKITFHTSEPVDFCYDVATEVVEKFGGSIAANAIKVAKGFHYLFEFIQLKDKSQKRLKGIYEIRYNQESQEVTIHQICKYSPSEHKWYYKFDIGSDKAVIGEQEDMEAFEQFKQLLRDLANQNEIQGEHVVTLPYLSFMKG